MRRGGDADERRQYAGYSAAELDAEFVRTQRSDLVHVLLRLLSLGFVYGTLARGVHKQTLGAAFLLLPAALEFILVMWFGLWLSRRVVSCPRFARSAGSPALIVFWTLLIAAIIAGVLAWDEPSGGLQPWLLGDHLRAALHAVVDSGLVWGLLAMAALLVFSTMGEVARWKQVGGVFVWTSITDLGMRIGVAVLLLLFGGVLFGVFADAIGAELLADPQRRAWLVFGLLLLIELAALLLGVLMHRDLSRKARAAATGR